MFKGELSKFIRRIKDGMSKAFCISSKQSILRQIYTGGYKVLASRLCRKSYVRFHTNSLTVGQRIVQVGQDQRLCLAAGPSCATIAITVLFDRPKDTRLLWPY